MRKHWLPEIKKNLSQQDNREMREEMSDQGSFILLHLKKGVAHVFLFLDQDLELHAEFHNYYY